MAVSTTIIYSGDITLEIGMNELRVILINQFGLPSDCELKLKKSSVALIYNESDL